MKCTTCAINPWMGHLFIYHLPWRPELDIHLTIIDITQVKGVSYENWHHKIVGKLYQTGLFRLILDL